MDGESDLRFLHGFFACLSNQYPVLVQKGGKTRFAGNVVDLDEGPFNWNKEESKHSSTGEALQKA